MDHTSINAIGREVDQSGTKANPTYAAPVGDMIAESPSAAASTAEDIPTHSEDSSTEWLGSTQKKPMRPAPVAKMLSFEQRMDSQFEKLNETVQAMIAKSEKAMATFIQKYVEDQCRSSQERFKEELLGSGDAIRESAIKLMDHLKPIVQDAVRGEKVRLKSQTFSTELLNKVKHELEPKFRKDFHEFIVREVAKALLPNLSEEIKERLLEGLKDKIHEQVVVSLVESLAPTVETATNTAAENHIRALIPTAIQRTVDRVVASQIAIRELEPASQADKKRVRRASSPPRPFKQIKTASGDGKKVESINDTTSWSVETLYMPKGVSSNDDIRLVLNPEARTFVIRGLKDGWTIHLHPIQKLEELGRIYFWKRWIFIYPKKKSDAHIAMFFAEEANAPDAIKTMCRSAKDLWTQDTSPGHMRDMMELFYNKYKAGWKMDPALNFDKEFGSKRLAQDEHCQHSKHEDSQCLDPRRLDPYRRNSEHFRSRHA